MSNNAVFVAFTINSHGQEDMLGIYYDIEKADQEIRLECDSELVTEEPEWSESKRRYYYKDYLVAFIVQKEIQ